MVSGGKEENIEIRLYNLNKNLKSSFSAVKKDINNLTKKKERLVQDINNKLSEIRGDFVKNQDFQSEIDSLNEKHNQVLKEIKKREKLKKELREALKLKGSVDLMIEGFKKANGIKKKFENLKNTVVDVNEFNNTLPHPFNNSLFFFFFGFLLFLWLLFLNFFRLFLFRFPYFFCKKINYPVPGAF